MQVEEKLMKEDAITFFNALVATGVFQKSIVNDQTGTVFYYLGDWKKLGLPDDSIQALAYGFYHLVQNNYLVAVKPKGKLAKQADKPHITRYVFVDDWNRMDSHNKTVNFELSPQDLIFKAGQMPQKN